MPSALNMTQELGQDSYTVNPDYSVFFALVLGVSSASGEWRVASGEWQVASGKWRVASGKWKNGDGVSSIYAATN
jgi:hypothetical protein